MLTTAVGPATAGDLPVLINEIREQLQTVGRFVDAFDARADETSTEERTRLRNVSDLLNLTLDQLA